MQKDFENEPYEPSLLATSAFIKLQSVATKCGAKKRNQETYCKAPAMKNGKCRLHGGKSTGPRTPEGLARSRRANWKHGEYSAENRALHRLLKTEFKEAMRTIQAIRETI